MALYASDLIGTDFPRSYKSPSENERNFDIVYGQFLEYGEELAKNLEQPAICRAYASYFDEQQNLSEEGGEKLKKRSLKRHLHLVSHLENREIGQNLHGKRNLASIILGSECREFRFDQTLYGRIETEPMVWRNRRIILKDSEKIMDYETLKMISELNPARRLGRNQAHYPVLIDQTMIIDVFGIDKYLLALRIGVLQVFDWENPWEPVRNFQLPTNLRHRKIGWKNINESIFIKALRRNDEKQCDELVFMIFKVFPFEFVTSFTIDDFAIPDWHGITPQIAMNDDFIENLTEQKAVLFSFDDVCAEYAEWGQNFGEPIGIEFDVTRFGEPLRVLNGKFSKIYCCPRLSPLLVGFSENPIKPLTMKSIGNSEVFVDFDKTIGSDFGMVSKNLIFPDNCTSAFMAYEKCDLVKYCVGYFDAGNCLKIEEIWRTRIFPEVENRERDVSLKDYVKIHETTLSDENLIVNLSIDYANILPNGMFDANIHAEMIVQFTYIIDYKTGEILRIIPIFGLQNQQKFPFCEHETMQIDDDLLIIQKKSEIIAKMEVWELIEPLQFIGVARNDAKIGWNRERILDSAEFDFDESIEDLRETDDIVIVELFGGFLRDAS